jgi:signal transduction histidine kinase
VERLAVLEDRERIAKDLHDGVIQSLFAVGMGLQGTSMASGDPRVAERIEAAVEEIDRVIRDLRNYIFGLRPGALADRALDAALRELVAEFEQRSEIVTVAEIDPAVASDLSSVAGEVLQLAREALSNVGRHSGAATCRLSLSRSDDAALLEVDDDGRGFDVEHAPRGDGLTNLEQRAASLGGRTVIVSTAAEGTTLRVELPLP